MKIFLCAVIVFFSGLIGIGVKNSYTKKLAFFTEINAFLHYISIKIAFFQDIYADCVLSFVQNNQLTNKQFFTDFYKLLKSGNFSKNEFDKIVKANLSSNEKEELFNLLHSIGSTDISNQETVLKGAKKQIEYKVETLQKLKTTKGDVVAKLSICAGLVLCILIY